MTTAANYRSIFTNSNTDDSKSLYESTKLVATNGGSGSNIPFIFLNLVRDDSEPTTTVVVEPTPIEQIDAENNNIITTAVDSYIKHLGTGDYNQIPTSSEQYRDTINPLINLINEGTDIVVQYILDSVMAAAKVRQMFDETFRLNTELAAEKQKYLDLQQGLNLDHVFAVESEQTTGGLELHLEVELTPMLLKYIELYGVPLPGQSVDSVKLTQIKEDMIAQGIDPYGREDNSSEPEEPVFSKEGPFSVNGYFPLYLEQSKAIEASPIDLANSVLIGDVTYWMPESVDQYLGDYDEWQTFRENDTFDNLIKTWNNDIEEGTETTFVATQEEPVIMTISFDIIN